MIVDCHVNIWEERHLRPLFAEQMARIRPGGMGLKADADTLYEAMRGVDRAIVFALGYGDSAGVESDDETTAAAVRRYPDKFVGFAYADPRRPDCMERLRRATRELGLKGVKYGPIYNGVSLDDPRMTPIYEHCVANDLPLTMHMGTTFARNAPVDLGRAIHVEPVALRYPDLKMVLAHMGHPWYEDTIAVVRKQPNVYAEISAIYYRPWQFWNIMISAQEYLITDKIFFGTDFPFSTVEDSLDGIRAVNEVVEGHASASGELRGDRNDHPRQSVRALVAWAGACLRRCGPAHAEAVGRPQVPAEEIEGRQRRRLARADHEQPSASTAVSVVGR